jgi:hypothetical protein
MNAKYLLPLPLALWLPACVIETRTGPPETDTVSVERDASEILRVNLNMGAGDLRVSGGARKLAEGELVYNVPDWRPVVRYTTAAGHGNLTIEQSGGNHSHVGNLKYRWDLRLADDVATDMAVHFGAGDARLNLGSLLLRSVDVDMGVGRMEMDLRGAPKRSYDVRIRGGVGEAVVKLPQDVGIYARAQGGIGSIQTHGLRRESDHWVNDAYDHSKINIRVDVSGGIGAITLDAR